MAGFQQLPSMAEMTAIKDKQAREAHASSSSSSSSSGIEERRKRSRQEGENGDDDKNKRTGDDPAGISALLLDNNSSNNSRSSSIPAVARAMGPGVAALFEKAKMRCGGCGSKVGASVLSRVLDKVKGLLVEREEVVSGIAGQSGDDAALILPPAPPALTVHSIDYFRSFVSDPYLFGQIAANHALSDIYAMNGDAVTALALAVVPYGPENIVEDTLVQMMGGCLSILKREGCALVGGHTSEGAEAAIGLSVNGTVHPDRVLHKGPCKAGDVLVLTKPLGTGVLMAADMRAKAAGPCVEKAFQSMLMSNREAARILHKHHCTACTDVTGFGFVGHLLEMLKFSEGSTVDSTNRCSTSPPAPQSSLSLVAQLHLDAIPLLDGAVECVAAGVLSSLQPQNIRSARAIGNPIIGEQHPCYQLLFDPQTSGGLLASVPKEAAAMVVEELHQAGYTDSAIVGDVLDACNLTDVGGSLVAPSGDSVHILLKTSSF